MSRQAVNWKRVADVQNRDIDTAIRLLELARNGTKTYKDVMISGALISLRGKDYSRAVARAKKARSK